MLDDSARRELRSTRFGDVRWFAEVGSTNSVLAELARAGAPEGVVVGADHQTAGRGRLGRRWEAPPGSSLLFSVLLRPHLPADRAPLLALLMAVAAAEACEEVAGVEPLLKWPNDLVVEDGKLGGILGESLPAAAGPAVVIGTGLNVEAGHPLVPGAVALESLSGRRVERDALLVSVLCHLDARYRALDHPDGCERLLEDYRARSDTLGRHVLVQLSTTTVEGRAVDVTPAGHLVVASEGRRQVVVTGDVVHLRAVAAR